MKTCYNLRVLLLGLWFTAACAGRGAFHACVEGRARPTTAHHP
jgi:hypothetical protein